MANTLQKGVITGAILAHQQSASLLKAVASLRCLDKVVIGWSGEESLHTIHDWIAQENSQEVQVISLKKVTNFAESRNILLEHIQNSWIFFLDSDEELIDGEKLFDYIRDFSQETVGSVKRTDYFYGKKLSHGEVKNMYLPRLVPASARFIRAVHETLPEKWKIRRLPIEIRHWPHQSISTFLGKISRYAERDAEHRKLSGERASLFQTLCYPPSKFLVNFLLKKGFLDGWRGCVYALLMSLHSFEVRVFLYEKTRF